MTPGIVVASYKVGYMRFDGKLADGPVPVFFSADPEKTAQAMKNSPQFAFDCLQGLVARLLEREELSREEAEQFLDNPRAGAARQPLVRSWQGQGSSSKPSGSKTPREEKGELDNQPFQLNCTPNYLLQLLYKAFRLQFKNS